MTRGYIKVKMIRKKVEWQIFGMVFSISDHISQEIRMP